MKFTVVIPIYNRASTVGNTLESVQVQTFKDFECIIVDDGSNDILLLRAKVEALEDPRFRIIEQSNQGGGAARNTGINAANGDWIAFLDSDDRFLPSKLEQLAEAIDACKTADVFAHYARVIRADDTRVIRPTRPPRLGESIAEFMFCFREFLQTSTLVVRAGAAKVVLFDPALRKAQDVDFVIRLQRTGYSFQFLEQVLSIWDDQPSEGRVGAPKKPDVVQAWFDQQRSFFSPNVQRAFEGTYLAYEISDRHPFRATHLILRAGISGSISFKLTLLTLLRTHLPPKAYRCLIDFLLRNTIGRSA